MSGLQLPADEPTHAERTRRGIIKARACGTIWGENGKILAERNRHRANAFADSLREVVYEICVTFKLLRNHGGDKMTRLAMELNKRGHLTQNGNTWHPTTVRRLVQRLGPEFRGSVMQGIADAWNAEAKKFGIPDSN